MGAIFGRTAELSEEEKRKKEAKKIVDDVKKSNTSLEKIFKQLQYDPSKNKDLTEALQNIVKEDIERKLQADRNLISAKADLSNDEKKKLIEEANAKAEEEIKKIEEKFKNGDSVLKILIDKINDVDNANKLEIYIAQDIVDNARTFVSKFDIDLTDKQRLKDEAKKVLDILKMEATTIYKPDMLKKLQNGLVNIGKIAAEWPITTFIKNNFATTSGILGIALGLLLAITGGILLMYLTPLFTGSPGESPGSPNTPSPTETTITPRDLQAIMTVMSLSVSGCYIVTNNSGNISIIRLEGCSDWYNNDNNQIYCGCTKTTNLSAPQLPDCTDSTLCNSPYCLNQGNCTTSGAGKCITADNQKLYMCNGQSLDQDGFVFYKYQFYPPSAVPSTIINLLAQKDDDNKKLTTIIVVIAVLVLITIFVTMYIMMNKKNGKMKLKSMRSIRSIRSNK